MGKIAVIILGTLLLVGLSIAGDEPIVSDTPVVKTDTLRIVDKDEVQRITRELNDKISKLEKRVARLEQTNSATTTGGQ